MNIVFIHQNFPGQFKHIADYLSRSDGFNAISISQGHAKGVPGIKNFGYRPQRAITKGIHPYLASTEAYVLNGQAVARVLLSLRDQGFTPDVVIAHTGWGEALYIKDVFPRVPVIGFFEFFYQARGADVDFDPEFPLGLDGALRVRTRNAIHLLSLNAVDVGITPTLWQKSVFPLEYHEKLRVIHEGIRTDLNAEMGASPQLKLPSGKVLGSQDFVVTYVARNLEPYRGFHIFMRSLQPLLDRYKSLQVVIVGGDDVSYGTCLPNGETYRQRAIKDASIDLDRVHFLGQVSYKKYLGVLSVSSVHVYLTVPFVLSWSMLEAMSMQCLVIASNTPPVREVIEDKRNGLLVDFLSPSAISDLVSQVVECPQAFELVRQEARRTILSKYSLENGINAYRQLLSEVVSNRL